MKILIVQDTDWIRRFPIQHTHLAERLAKRGHEIRVIDYEILWQTEGEQELVSKRRIQFISRVVPDANIMVIRPPILKIPILDYVSMLFTYRQEINRQIQEFKPDLIWGNDILTTYLAFSAGKKKKIPLLFYSIDIDHRLIPYRFLQPLGKWIESWNIRHADLVLSINEGLREYTVRMGAPRDKTGVIRAGIDLDRYDPSKVKGDEIRKHYGIADDDVVLFFMGWLYHFSGLKEVAIELAKVKDQWPSIKLFIIGDGDAYEHLKTIREDYHLEQQMILAGKQPYDLIPELIAAADICLLPGYDNEIMHDIVPIKMYEYMAIGKPIIATKLYGVMKEFGIDHGIIYTDKPEDVISKALELINEGILKNIGSKGRVFVENNSWENITDECERTLVKIMIKE
jgi:glycosyltransferase involved in cell wall biosynthesis